VTGPAGLTRREHRYCVDVHRPIVAVAPRTWEHDAVLQGFSKDPPSTGAEPFPEIPTGSRGFGKGTVMLATAVTNGSTAALGNAAVDLNAFSADRAIRC
jgi:hypothetical protein